MLIGYARVSTSDQDLNLQTDALEKAGCEQFYDDVASGAKDDREGLKKALSFMRKGDTLVVWRLDRLARSLKNLIEIVSELDKKGIGLRSLQESIDTTTSGGKLIFHIFGALAEFEREVIRERTNAGLQAARSRGKKGGRPIKFDEKKKIAAKRLMQNRELSITELCEALNISRATLYRHMSHPPNRKLG